MGGDNCILNWEAYLHFVYPAYLHFVSGIQFCIDGIPAFANNCNQKSLKVAQIQWLSLPPGVRCKAEQHVLYFLMPDDIHGMQQKKYYDFAADFELNELFHVGVEGIKVKVFSTSMDTKGREELLGMSCVCVFPS